MAIPRRTMLLAAGMAAANAPSARTQPAAWPTRPLSLIIPWAPGGGTDLVFRAMAPLLSERLGQPVAVLNRPGGNGTVGHMAIAPRCRTAPVLAPSPLSC
ncbi:hypothetical protein ACFQU2_06400 [Siccirubricoccus deserti]